MGGQRIRKNRERVGRKTDQRGQSSQLGIRQIDQQVPACGSISTPLPDRRFFFRSRKNRERVGRKTDQRGQSSQLGIRQIDQQVPACGSISTPLPDRRFFFRGPPAFSQAFDHFLDTGCFPPGPHHLERFCQLWKGRKRLPSG